MGENQNYIGSDAVGLAPYTKKISYLEDGDWAVIDVGKVEIYNQGKQVSRDINITSISELSIEKGGLSIICIKKYMNSLRYRRNLKKFYRFRYKIIKG